MSTSVGTRQNTAENIEHFKPNCVARGYDTGVTRNKQGAIEPVWSVGQSLKLCLPWHLHNYRKTTRDQVKSVAQVAPASMLGYIINITLAVISFTGHVSTVNLFFWALGSYSVALLAIMKIYAKRKITTSDVGYISRRGGRNIILFSAVLALPWGLLSFIFIGDLPPRSEIILVVLSIGMAASGAALLASIPLAAVTYTTFVITPVIVKCIFIIHDTHYYMLSAIALCFLIFLMAMISATSRIISEKIAAVKGLEYAIAEVAASKQDTERLALTDSLTGLANRHVFHSELDRILKDTQVDDSDAEPTKCYAVFLLDLDNFKSVNDSLGHPIGDELLKAVAGRLNKSVRSADILARLGGDEFALVIECDKLQIAPDIVARRLVEAISHPFIIDGHTIIIGVSVGIALAPDNGRTAEEILVASDLALYSAKHDGKNRHSFFKVTMVEKAQASRQLEMGIRDALKNDQFRLHYQPIINLRDQSIIGFEALARWHHPVSGWIAPDQFIPVAEASGLILPFGEWCLNEACREAQKWPSKINVAVNLSSLQFLDSLLVDHVQRALSDSGLDPSRLELEITETVLMAKDDVTLQTLHKLKKIGVRIAMDDFGTGYSSLSYLQSFPFDKIKVDRTFISNLGEGPAREVVVRAVIDIAHAWGMRTTAEGVETNEQNHLLSAMECDEGQGYHFSRPVPREKVPDVIELWTNK